ncbi:MAG: DNA helicase RecQ [Alphaproteobacteria bacterium]|nr:DNA helicase RecQ [Alphaproteobacteria bacterium]
MTDLSLAPPCPDHAPTLQDAESRVRSVFGFDGFRPDQVAIVEKLLRGENLLAVLPTGAGKSLCYQVAALMKARPTIVVSPLIALMDDQVAALRANGVDAGALHSALPREEKVASWRRYVSGDLRLLYMSPEQLMTDRMLGALDANPPAQFIVDEAHCISKWGVSFRPDYEALSVLKQRFPDCLIAGFTATADRTTQRDIADKLFAGRGATLISGFDRPNLHLSVAPTRSLQAQLTEFLEPRQDQSGIVYCGTRKGVDETAAMLSGLGFTALPYHAGMDSRDRAINAERFLAEPGVVMVATVAFGMGIDKPDVRYVVHANLPGSMEAYYQEIGRAGRDGAPADCLMLFSLKDMQLRRRFIEQDGATESDADHRIREHKRLDALLAYCEATRCRRQLLLAYFGEEAEPCGKCDICDDPPVLIDGSDAARLLLAAIDQTGARFGAAHLIDVLRGAATAKIEQFSHARLNCHGAGAAHSKDWWQAFIRQAVAAGAVSIDIERFGALQPTALGREIAQGQADFSYRAIEPAKGKTASRRTRRNGAEPSSMEGVDEALLIRLKALRRELAAKRAVPAYVVFADAALIDMCRLMPQTLDQMAAVNGVGPAKLEKFGPAFLEVLRQTG